MAKKYLVVGLSVLLLALLALGVFLFMTGERLPEHDSGEEVVINPISETEDEGVSVVQTEGSSSSSFSIPDLDQSFSFPTMFTPAMQQDFTANINAQRAILKEDDTRLDAWLALAALYYSSENYDLAREIWEMLIAVAPQDATAYLNLAKMYQYSTPDFPKAETYFKKTIEVDSDNMAAYADFFGFYKAWYGERSTLAESVLRDGIKNNPQSFELHFVLGAHLVEKGDKEGARTVYQEGAQRARAANSLDAAAEFQAQIDAL